MTEQLYRYLWIHTLPSFGRQDTLGTRPDKPTINTITNNILPYSKLRRGNQVSGRNRRYLKGQGLAPAALQVSQKSLPEQVEKTNHLATTLYIANSGNLAVCEQRGTSRHVKLCCKNNDSIDDVCELTRDARATTMCSSRRPTAAPAAALGFGGREQRMR